MGQSWFSHNWILKIKLRYSFKEHLLSTYPLASSGLDTENTEEKRTGLAPQESTGSGHAEEMSCTLPISSWGKALYTSLIHTNIQSRSSARLAYTEPRRALLQPLNKSSPCIPLSIKRAPHTHIHTKPYNVRGLLVCLFLSKMYDFSEGC